ncbi:MAG: hypothetical protein ABIH82_02280 [Candidatus Woesearchaeota archaeon]
MNVEIFYLVNDYLEAERVQEELAQYGRVKTFNCERDFREAVNKGPLPNLVVLEEIVRWAYPAPEAPKPPHEVIEGTSLNAGVRCYDFLRKKEGKKSVPVIFYYDLSSEEIELALKQRGYNPKNENLHFLSKDNVSFVELRKTFEKIFKSH